MPSDAKKKQQQKKKEAAKARQSGKKPPQNNSQAKAAEDGKEQTGDLQNGTNGTAISTEGKKGEAEKERGRGKEKFGKLLRFQNVCHISRYLL